VSVDQVLRAADAVVREQQRRSRGEPHDSRFDVPLSMLLDLDDQLQDGVRVVEPIHSQFELSERAALDGCTNDAHSDAEAHMSTCPMR